MATTNYTTELQKLYVAYFNRPADPAGLAFYNTVVANANGSTAAVSADFAASGEYKAAYAGMNNTQIITQVYQNLFSHGPDAAGRDYWVNALDKKIFTIDQIVAEVAGGAQGSDKTTFNNKVSAATSFTAAVDTAAELKAYSGDAANAAAKIFIAGITTDASLAAAVTPAGLDAAVATVVKAGTVFTLAGGLADLDAAKDAIPAFLKTLDLDNDGVFTDTTADDITNATTGEVAVAAAAVKAIVPAYTGTSAAIKAAVLADAQADLNKALSDAQTDYNAKVTAAGKVPGLSAAISADTAAKANLAALTKAELITKAAQNSAEVSYETLNSKVGSPALDVAIKADGTIDNLIELKDGKLALVKDVTEANHAGVTALLNSINAEMSAAAAVVAGTNAAAGTTLDVAIHDIADGTEATALVDLGKAIKATTIKGAAPTAAEVQTEVATLKGLLAAAAPADKAAAQAKVDAFNTEVNKYLAVGGTDSNPVASAVDAAKVAVDNATKAVSTLDKAVIALNTALSHETTLNGLNAATKAATDAFADNGFEAPVTVTGVIAATAGADIFLAGAGTIANFGLSGKDVLYVGSDVTFNAGKLSAGNASVLEVFLVQNGANAEVHVETTTFGSATADQVVITLAGVATTDLTFSNGIISHV